MTQLRYVFAIHDMRKSTLRHLFHTETPENPQFALCVTSYDASVRKTLRTSKIAVLLQQIQLLDEDDDHCEVPCGIYGDSLRVALIHEHIRTIEKASNKINEISRSKSPNYNQLVRWVVNKETHAEEIQHIVSQYFLHQRIKPKSIKDGKGHQMYVQHLENLHRILVLTMKCKQSTDGVNTATLKAAVRAFEDGYFHAH